MGGGMEANKNRFVEEWGAARENLEHNFRWTRRNFAIIGIFGIAIPVLVYKGIVREFEEKKLEADVLKKENEPQKIEAKAENRSHNGQLTAVNHSGAEMPDDLSLPSTEVGPGNSDKPKICGSDAN